MFDLVGGIPIPLKNMSSSVGIIIPNLCLMGFSTQIRLLFHAPPGLPSVQELAPGTTATRSRPPPTWSYRSVAL